MPHPETLTHLTALYAADPDPWGHLTEPYEREKYERTLALVGSGPFDAILEVGCGIGALTEHLAPRAAEVVSLDCIPAALQRARGRLRDVAHVTFVEGPAPDAIPEGMVPPQVVLLSEVLYFMTPSEIARLARWIDGRTAPDARVILVNWTGPTGEALTGREAADLLRQGLPAWHAAQERHEGYDTMLLHRVPPAD